ncbi:MAG: hypothetical protein ACOX6N_00565 [Patescibacteria group bacterium]|jgi:hypothetical protein
MAGMMVGIFDNYDDADKALRDLRGAGFDVEDMELGGSRRQSNVSEAGRRGGVTTMRRDRTGNIGNGVITGAIIGALAGLIYGIVATIVPGLAGILFVGPIAGALGLTGIAAVTVTGAVLGAAIGGLIGALERAGGVREEAGAYYDEEVRGEDVMLMVPVADGRSNEVERIFNRNGVAQVRTVDVSV